MSSPSYREPKPFPETAIPRGRLNANRKKGRPAFQYRQVTPIPPTPPSPLPSHLTPEPDCPQYNPPLSPADSKEESSPLPLPQPLPDPSPSYLASEQVDTQHSIDLFDKWQASRTATDEQQLISGLTRPASPQLTHSVLDSDVQPTTPSRLRIKPQLRSGRLNLDPSLYKVETVELSKLPEFFDRLVGSFLFSLRSES